MGDGCPRHGVDKQASKCYEATNPQMVEKEVHKNGMMRRNIHHPLYVCTTGLVPEHTVEPSPSVGRFYLVHTVVMQVGAGLLSLSEGSAET